MIGILIIGQSPRPQLMEEFRRVIPADVKIRLVGILDDIPAEMRHHIKPKEKDDTLFAVLPDGSDICLSHREIAKLAPSKLQQLADEGCQIVLFCCTGEFPELEDTPFLLPARILTKTVCAVAENSRLGVFIPLPEQEEISRKRWQAVGIDHVETVALAPNAPEADILKAAQKMAANAPDYIVYDCMSYNHALRRKAGAIIKQPAILSVSLVARILAELIDT